MKRRTRIARVLRLVHVTKAVVPVIVRIGKTVAIAYRTAWRGPKPRRRVVHVIITGDAGPLKRQLTNVQAALDGVAALGRASRRAAVQPRPPSSPRSRGMLFDDDD